jgi:ABC-type multidrug transport system fused ATPase/permease subunit
MWSERIRPFFIHPVAALPSAVTGAGSAIRRLWSYNSAVRRGWAQTALLIAISPVISAGLLWTVKDLIDQVFIGGEARRLPFYLTLYSSLVGLKLLIGYADMRVTASVTERIARDARIDLYRHILSLSPGSLRVRTGDLLMRLSSDADQVEYLIYGGPIALLSNALNILIFVSVLLMLSWQLTACALMVTPALGYASLRTSPWIRRSARIARRALGAWSSRAEERLDNVSNVQALSGADFEIGAFERMCTNAMRAELLTVKLQARSTLLLETLAGLGGVAVIVVGAAGLQNGSLTVGTFVAFLGSVGSLLAPICSFAKAPARFQRATVRSQRVIEVLQTPSAVAERPGAKTLLKPKGRLEFRNVHFSYTRDQQILAGINLSVEPGETVAIVGANGGGKSTLLKLAIRLHDPTVGAVTVDGHDIREFTLVSLRRAISVIFQEPFVVGGSISANIGYGLADISERQIQASAQAAQVTEFAARLPGGCDAPVGPRGAWLSGGQRQRVAFARSLLRDSHILLLDEATAGIDSETEALVQDAVQRLRGERTIIMVGHRLSSIRGADRIVVIENGRVVEADSPSNLLKNGARYRGLFAAQFSPIELPT